MYLGILVKKGGREGGREGGGRERETFIGNKIDD
jgi:hypothetical protein